MHIYVQERTDDTDEQCKAAKEAWDALTDAAEGAGRRRERRSGLLRKRYRRCDPRTIRVNGDEIGDKELLVVSFGTSFNDSRAERYRRRIERAPCRLHIRTGP